MHALWCSSTYWTTLVRNRWRISQHFKTSALSTRSTLRKCVLEAQNSTWLLLPHVPGQIILPQSEQEILDCAVSNPTAQGFANCAAPQFGYRLSDDQRAIASCAMKSEGDSSDFLDCAGSAVVGGELTPDEQAVLNCAKESNGDTSDFASCSASSLIDTHATREQKIAIECAVQSQGDYTGMAACAGANLFNLQLNPDQQIAVECVVDTGGQPYAAAGCIATRLTARELGNLCTGRYATTAWHESDDG